MHGIWLQKMTKTISSVKSKLHYEEIEEDRKSFSVTVYPSGKIIYKVPQKSSSLERKRFLAKKSEWINKQRAFFKQFSLKKQSFISGSEVLYLGRRYQLIVKERNPKKISFAANKILIQSMQSSKRILKTFMKQRAESIFAERLCECLKLFPNLQIKQFRLKIRRMNKRWGSYHTNGDIFLNPELIKAPKRCIDYVICHELCHQTHKSHNHKFFNLLEQKCPDYKTRKIELELKILG